MCIVEAHVKVGLPWPLNDAKTAQGLLCSALPSHGLGGFECAQ